jgi:hypothetical protein
VIDWIGWARIAFTCVVLHFLFDLLSNAAEKTPGNPGTDRVFAVFRGISTILFFIALVGVAWTAFR